MNNFTVGAQALYSTSIEEPIYKQYNKPVAKELFPLPKPVLYLLMAALALVGVAYVIVGHLIKDLAVDIADCMLGPPEDGDKDNRDDDLRHVAQSRPPPPLNLSQHLWEQDDVDVVVPLPDHDGHDQPAATPLVFSLLSQPAPKDSGPPPHGLSDSPGTVPRLGVPVALKVGSGGVLEGVLGGLRVNHGTEPNGPLRVCDSESVQMSP